MTKYKEIKKLHKLLDDAGIAHRYHALYDGYQVEYPMAARFRKLSAVEHCISYGHDRDLIEIMGLLTKEEEKVDSVLGYQTAQQVFERIQKHWNSYKESEDK